MFRKLVALGLSIFMVMTFLAGCNLFSHDFDRDYEQVIAEVKPITYTWQEGAETKNFVSKRVEITKNDLLLQFNQNGQSLMQEQSMTLEQALDYLVEQLLIRELILIEADYMIAKKDPNNPQDSYFHFTVKDENTIKQNVYKFIDEQLFATMNEILSENGEDKISEPTKEEAKTPTYPIKPVEEIKYETIREENEANDNVAVWDVEESRVPQQKDYLELAAVKRLANLLITRAKENKKATQEDLASFDKDKSDLDNAKATDIYKMIPTFSSVKFLVEKYERDTIKLTKLQKYIEDDRRVDSITNITEEDIVDYYNTTLSKQKASYAVETNYETAVKGEDDLILYTPNSKFFYVKHILLPFGDAEKKVFDEMKNSGAYTDQQILDYRKTMVDSMAVYKHKDGENDTSVKYSFKQAYSYIVAEMAKVKNNPKEAERRFDDLIYEYNTDPGIFSKARGYQVADDDTDSGYMPEFAKTSKDVFKNGEVGQLASDYAITDYGVHIIYLASKTVAGQVKGLDDFVTPGQYKTMRELIKDKLKSDRIGSAYSKWQDEKISYFLNTNNNYVAKYKDLYKDLYAQQ